MHALDLAFATDWPTAGAAALKGMALVLTAVALFRVTVRRTLAEQAPYDVAVFIAVGAVVGRTATSSTTSYFTGAAVLVALFVVHAAITRLRFYRAAERVVDPPALVLVRDGVADERTIRRSGLTQADLDGLLRQHGVQDVEEVELAIFEPKGAVTVQKRS